MTLTPNTDPSLTESTLTNWAGNVSFGAAAVHRPESVAELQRIVASASAARALGTGHSFNTIADTAGDLISLAALPPVIDIDHDRAQVRVAGGVRFGELAPVLHRAGLALHNLGSLPHISIAGACATGTHGSGVGNPNLASAVSAAELVDANGEVRTLSRDQQDGTFDGSVVSLGSLGIVTTLTLNVVPTFEIEQYVYDDLAWSELVGHLHEILAAGYSVSIFTDWRDGNQIWLKRLADGAPAPELFGARPADGPRHPVPGVDPRHCTTQLGVPGPWHERLPHFRLDFTPSNGEELQTEYLLPSGSAVAALQALAEIRTEITPVLQISEIRTIAADTLWLSPSYRQDSVALHFTWIADTAAVLPVVRAVEARLRPLQARPHWGKVFEMTPGQVRERYPRFADFSVLRDGFDPGAKFANPFTKRLFAGS